MKKTIPGLFSEKSLKSIIKTSIIKSNDPFQSGEWKTKTPEQFKKDCVDALNNFNFSEGFKNMIKEYLNLED